MPNVLKFEKRDEEWNVIAERVEKRQQKGTVICAGNETQGVILDMWPSSTGITQCIPLYRRTDI